MHCQATGCQRQTRARVRELGRLNLVVTYCTQHLREYERLVRRQGLEFGGAYVRLADGQSYPRWRSKEKGAQRFFYASKKGFHSY
jgi:hypothetical protein